MASQLFSVKGKKPQYNYTEAINAQLPYVPAMYQAKQSREQADLEFQANKDYLKDQTELSEEALAQQEKDAKISNIIALGKVGTDTYFANEAAKSSPSTTNAVNEVVDNDVLGGDAGDISNAVDQRSEGTGKALLDYLKPNQGLTEISNKENLVGGLDSALTVGNVTQSGGAGLIAGGLVNKPKDKTKSALYGAGAGALLNYLSSGGDLYSTAIGGVSGGAGGLLSTYL